METCRVATALLDIKIYYLTRDKSGNDAVMLNRSSKPQTPWTAEKNTLQRSRSLQHGFHIMSRPEGPMEWAQLLVSTSGLATPAQNITF